MKAFTALAQQEPLVAPFPAELMDKAWQAIEAGRAATTKTQRERDWIEALAVFFKEELEAVLTRAGITAEWNGGPEQGTALIHVLPELQRLERYERRAFSKRRGAIQDL